jgi:hypothetical protein
MVRTLAAVLVIVALAAPAGPARALTLADVDAFFSVDGTLFFSNFEVIQTGSLADLDLSSVLVVPTDKGFTLDPAGSLLASGGELGDLLVRFDVDAELEIIAATLGFSAEVSGVGAGASVTETFAGIDNLQAFVFAIGEGPFHLEDRVIFDPALVHLRVTKDILLDSTTISGPPGSAEIFSITQEFEVIPEPGTGILALIGLAGALLLRLRGN